MPSSAAARPLVQPSKRLILLVEPSVKSPFTKMRSLKPLLPMRSLISPASEREPVVNVVKAPPEPASVAPCESVRAPITPAVPVEVSNLPESRLKPPATFCTSSVVPEPREIVLLAREAPTPRTRVPPRSEVDPVKVFAPFSVRVASPPLLKLYAPPTAPLSVVSLAMFKVVSAVSVVFEANVSAPLLKASPRNTVLEKDTAFAIVRCVRESLERRPPLKVRVPVPSAASLPSWIVPALKATPPVKGFEPLRTKVPGSLFTSDPFPSMTPPKVPEARLNAVAFRFRAPAPLREAMVCAAVLRFVVPSSVKAVVTASEAVSLTFKTAKVPTDTFCPVRNAEPASVSEPLATVVAPVYPLEPVSVRRPAPALNRLPAADPSLSKPVKLPLLTVSAVELRRTVPAPSSESIVTALFHRLATPSTVSAVETGKNEPL